MKRRIGTIVLFIAVLMMAGCQSECQKMERNGGVIGTYAGDWIVVNYSGGKITDVWKLENVIVQSEEHSDGWLFIDEHGNATNIGGDAKAIRVKNRAASGWDKYHEYHFEFETQPYEVKYNTPKPVASPSPTATPAK